MEISLDNISFTGKLAITLVVIYLIVAILDPSRKIIDISYYALALYGGEVKTLIIDHGQIWRVVTASFLHTDIMHLFLNTFSLYYLGMLAENFFSWKKIFSVFILTSITGSLLSLIFISANDVSVGASSAIFGIVGLFLTNTFLGERKLPIEKGSLILIIIINLFWGFGINQTGAGLNINNFAHIGGLLGGMLLGLIVKPDFTHDKFSDNLNKILFWISSIILALSIIGLLYWLIS